MGGGVVPMVVQKTQVETLMVDLGCPFKGFYKVMILGGL